MKRQVCAGGFIMKDNLFLLGKRSLKKKWAPGVWDIVGGHSLKHEEPLDTLKRETYEEIGVTVLQAELMTATDVFDESQKDYFKYYIYMITEWEGEPVNLTDEHTEIKWFAKDELVTLQLALPEYINMIDKWHSSAND